MFDAANNFLMGVRWGRVTLGWMGIPFYSTRSVRGGQASLGAGRFRARGAEEGQSNLYFCSVRACVIPCGRGEVRYEGPDVRTLAVPIKETKVLFVSKFLSP